MIADNKRNYKQEDYNFNQYNQKDESYADVNQQENSEDENLSYEGEISKPFENENLNTAFPNALNLNELVDDPDENDSEGDSIENEEDENYDQEEITEPETFADDGYKID